MRLGIEEIYNLLHNNSAESVAVHIRDEADYVVGSLSLLDQVLEIKEIYAEDIRTGTPFTLAFARHIDPNKPVPKIHKRAKNFSKAIFKFVVAGFPIATREAAEKKLKICESNKCGFFNGSICKHQNCGCYSKVKTFFETESCPIDKW